jgi:hypothetical protein
MVLQFLVPFGVIVGLLDLGAFGGFDWFWAQTLHWGLTVILFFAAYYGLDAIIEWRVEPGTRAESAEPHASTEKPSGPDEPTEQTEKPRIDRAAGPDDHSLQ